MIRTETTAASAATSAALAAATVEQMAQVIVEMEANGRPVTAETLANYGEFTSAEVSSHGTAARDRAVEIKRGGRRA